MKYFIHARFKNETSLNLYETDTDIIIDVDSDFREFTCERQAVAQFHRLVSTSTRLRKLGKCNQFYLLEVIMKDCYGNHVVERWVAND